MFPDTNNSFRYTGWPLVSPADVLRLPGSILFFMLLKSPVCHV